MSAIIGINVRNGISPGVVTQNVTTIDWKYIDDATTPYTSAQSAIPLGLNSFTKYNYLVFSGAFTTLGNVTITYLNGNLPNGITLMTSASISVDIQKESYTTPTINADNTITSNNFMLGDAVSLLVGTCTDPTLDPAYAPNKTAVANNTAGVLYTNYFISQLQTLPTATTGTIGPITLQISYDEV